MKDRIETITSKGFFRKWRKFGDQCSGGKYLQAIRLGETTHSACGTTQREVNLLKELYPPSS